jgi:hypothetical protein
MIKLCTALNRVQILSLEHIIPANKTEIRLQKVAEQPLAESGLLLPSRLAWCQRLQKPFLPAATKFLSWR